MSRRIVTSQLESTSPITKVDTYFDKVIKYIPADIVGAWVAVTGLIRSANEIPTAPLLWFVFIVGLVLTAIWTGKQTRILKKSLARTQILVSTGAFFVWVFALGGPFESLSFYRPLYGSLLLIFYTLVTALIDPPEG
jgi:hypothetical protein